MNEQFTCKCNGKTEIIADDKVLHYCTTLAAQHHDLDRRPVPWVRIQVNPELTGGKVKYNWFVDWT